MDEGKCERKDERMKVTRRGDNGMRFGEDLDVQTQKYGTFFSLPWLFSLNGQKKREKSFELVQVDECR